MRVSLTKAGTALREKAKNVPMTMVGATGLSIPEIEQLRDELIGLRNTLHAYAGLLRVPSVSKAGAVHTTS